MRLAVVARPFGGAYVANHNPVVSAAERQNAKNPLLHAFLCFDTENDRHVVGGDSGRFPYCVCSFEKKVHSSYVSNHISVRASSYNIGVT